MSKKKQKEKERQDSKTVDENLNTTDKSNLSDKQGEQQPIVELSIDEQLAFEKDKKDTRLKHVYLNDKGLKLFDEIFSMQKKRIYKALLNSSSNEVVNFNNVLNKIIDE